MPRVLKPLPRHPPTPRPIPQPYRERLPAGVKVELLQCVQGSEAFGVKRGALYWGFRPAQTYAHWRVYRFTYGQWYNCPDRLFQIYTSVDPQESDPWSTEDAAPA